MERDPARASRRVGIMESSGRLSPNNRQALEAAVQGLIGADRRQGDRCHLAVDLRTVREDSS